mmetsp:Transcript_78012/g.210951  ORF Transcript_78012/g.210951 Transcript_78012/m.210951 type:complete len:252 (+) Transcript_78012:1470-2225(+)
MWRERRRTPPPQLREHAPHADHAATSQSRGVHVVLHDLVSSREPRQAFPPCEAFRSTTLVRDRCSSAAWHEPLHSDQSPSTQSSGCSQSRGQRLVSTKGPSQKSPPQEPMRSMTRWRWQSWSQEGADHWLQAENSQSTGLHPGLQLGRSQAVTIICAPEQGLSGSPAKRSSVSSGSVEVARSCRWRVLVAAPHTASQGLSADHGAHAQKLFGTAPSTAVQFSTSFAWPGAQGLPHPVPGSSTARWRKRWAP